MRTRQRFVAATLPVVALFALTGCGQLQEATGQLQGATDKLDEAQACTQALKAANFMPKWADPDQTQSEAQDKVEELTDLIIQTPDERLKENLEAVKSSVDKVANGEITVENSADWMQQQLESMKTVTATCSKLGE